MKTLVACVLAVGMALSAAVPADARQGCGPGGHRGPRGYCRPNNGGYNRGGGYVVGRHYAGRGYWYDNRWYQSRYRDHGNWRYR